MNNWAKLKWFGLGGMAASILIAALTFILSRP
jgi:hypothetical protein